MRRRARLIGGSAVITALALVGGGVLAAPSDAASPPRTTLAGSTPAWAKRTALKSAAPAGDFVNIRVYLGWQHSADAAKTALAVSTPGSSTYGQYLTPAQFRQRFAPKQADVTAVQQFLRSAGFSVVETATNNRYVAAEGTVAQAQAAFGTKLGEYTVQGRTLRSPESAVSVPASIGAAVESVVGLDQGAALQAPTRSAGDSPKQNHGAPGVGFRAGQPCSLWYGEKTVSTPNAPAYGSSSKPLAPCGYTPAQVRGLYGLSSTDLGTGQTVAFVGATASPTLQQDVATYSTKHGLAAPKITEDVPPGVYKHPDTPQQIPGDFYGEETLDAEAIHSMAPDATLLYVASSNAYQDFDRSINRIVDKGLSHIISISYGFGGENVPQGYINSLNNTFVEAAATGIGVYVSSGDNGDEVTSFGSPQVDFYANDPFVTAVGGTSAAIVPSDAAPTGLSSASVDEPTSALNDASVWKRSFEVAWQTGYDPISKTATDHLATAPYELDGTLSGDLPGAFFGGDGGGVSKVFAEPSYQTAAIGARGGRVLPDISALGDPNTGFLVGQTQQFSTGTKYDEYRIGGTSVAAPLMAGIAAVADQRHGSPLGFLNPRIYSAYGASAATAFYDVDQAGLFGTTTSDPLPAVVRVNYVNSENASGGLSYSLRTLEEPGQTLHSGPGFDTATGVGTPNGDGFFTAIAGK